MSPLELAVTQIVQARKYTLGLLDQVEVADWFRPAPGQVTHLAWQAAHLAVAEFWLTMIQVRGPQPADAPLMPESFLKQFGRQSVPDFDPSHNPSVEEIRAILDRVHQQALQEIRALSEAEWEAPPLRPHPWFSTKLGALWWCAQHEMVHAGQIGLVRRLLGYPPLW